MRRIIRNKKRKEGRKRIGMKIQNDYCRSNSQEKEIHTKTGNDDEGYSNTFEYQKYRTMSHQSNDTVMEKVT